jgi:endonuclease-3
MTNLYLTLIFAAFKTQWPATEPYNLPGQGIYQAYRPLGSLRKPMTKKEKAAKIAKILDQLYPETPIPLSHVDPYSLLVAVVLSAQCTDERVNKITPILFKQADNPFDMVKLSIDEIQEIIRPCGLSPAKSKAIYGFSKILAEEYRGQVPDTFEQLEALPGVGHKSASVIMSQAFGKPAFPVDTHIHRLAYRWGLSNGKSVVQTERDLKKLFPEASWNKLHLQIIYFGREYCPARAHDFKHCPICSIYGRKSLIK